jgi:hypothetical protein
LIKVKRIYDNPKGRNGFRILVDRLWPRGLRKDEVKIDLWQKDIAPSNSLRKWFSMTKRNGMNLSVDILENWIIIARLLTSYSTKQGTGQSYFSMLLRTRDLTMQLC